jgi:mono/diheme cytochrome c family protein
MVAAGQQLFATRCAGCHGAAGVGGARGPNLTDDTWLWVQPNQPPRPQIEAVIRNGVSMPKVHMNGMPAVGAQMTAAEVESLSAYISTL